MALKIKAFTLIEMLIVIVIIGILAAALVPRLQSIQWRARDTQRKTDLRTIYNANEIYFVDNGNYARSNACAYNINGCHSFSMSWAYRIITLTGILTTIPVDPLNIRTNFSINQATWDYYYQYGNVYDNDGFVGRKSYDLFSKLENINDPDRCAIKDYKNIQNISYCNVTSYLLQLYELSPHNLK